MNDFRTRLSSIMADKNIRAAELSRRTGISKPRLSQYLSGTYLPKADAVCEIAKALNVSESYLLGTSDDPHLPSALPYKKLRVIGEISCGEPIFANDDNDGFFVTDSDIDADFCLIAKGDSMIDARICNGDVVFIKKCDIVENNEIAAVIINDEATLKRVFYYPNEQRIVLAPENKSYKPLVFEGEELEKIHIIGRAVAFKSKIV